MHGVSINWLAQGRRDGHFAVEDCNTDQQCADMFTKGFGNPENGIMLAPLLGFGAIHDPWREPFLMDTPKLQRQW